MRDYMPSAGVFVTVRFAYFYRSEKRFNRSIWMDKVKVLFVCLGNICRSPLAEAIFKTRMLQHGMDSMVEADSCGTAGYHIGDSPDPRTIANAKRNGIEIKHVGRQLTQHDLEHYDFILAMDRSNFSNILNIRGAESHRKKISLLRTFDSARNDDEVPDPYYGDELAFQQVFEIADNAVNSFISYLKSTHLKV